MRLTECSISASGTKEGLCYDCSFSAYSFDKILETSEKLQELYVQLQQHKRLYEVCEWLFVLPSLVLMASH